MWILKFGEIANMEINNLRKILESMEIDDGIHIIGFNLELNDLIQNGTAVQFVKAQRIRWLGHVNRMAADCTVKKAMTGKLMSVKVKGKSRNRW